MNTNKIIFETKRTYVKLPEINTEDVQKIVDLWNDPEVVKYVGFPYGLNTTHEKIKNQIKNYGDTVIDSILLVYDKVTDEILGECKIGAPDQDGISRPDIKFFPKFFGQGLGVEVMRAAIDYTFKNTEARIVQGTPNKKNIGSQKMQERVGMKKVGEDKYEFPEHMRSYTEDVECYIYQITKENYAKGKNV